MSADEDRVEPDCVPGAPHPRETQSLIGQSAAEASFLEAATSQRLHHAWLITGPKGVGKATLAWRMASFLLSHEPELEEAGLFEPPPAPTSLEIDPASSIARRISALSEPRLFLLRRGFDDKGKPRRVITVDETRALKSFLALSAADGGRRVVVVDSVDEMNSNAANALLKLLEEPPDNTVLLLISHQPARLLPTIRSRCRTLRCVPLSPQDLTTAVANAGIEMTGDEIALAALSSGSPGVAIELLTGGGLDLYGSLARLVAKAPEMSRPEALAFAAQAKPNTAQTTLIIQLIDIFLSRLATHGAGSPAANEAAKGEAELFSRIAPDQHAARVWAQLHQELGTRTRHGIAVNLDPSALILDTVLDINKAARGILSAR